MFDRLLSLPQKLLVNLSIYSLSLKIKS
jgi:hypothetical protein